MRVLVDTNILIDILCMREDFYDEAEKVFVWGLKNKIHILITDISYINALYVGKRYGYSVESLKSSLYKIAKFSELAIIDNDIVKESLLSDWNDVEDATQYYAAISNMADCILTRNTNDFKMSTIPVYSPKEFISKIENEG